LREALVRYVPNRGHILDLGAGDGQTFALVANAVPKGTRVSIEEPNPGYLADYAAFVPSQPHLLQGIKLQVGFENIDTSPAPQAQAPPPDGTIVLRRHSLIALAPNSRSSPFLPHVLDLTPTPSPHRRPLVQKLGVCLYYPWLREAGPWESLNE
jgi:hypothetical protein